MKKILVFLISLSFGSAWSQNADSTMISSVYREVLLNGTCYSELHDLCKNIGHRVAGSESAMKAILWGQERLKTMGADTTYLMPVDVPKWNRGKHEKGVVIIGRKKETIPVAA